MNLIEAKYQFHGIYRKLCGFRTIVCLKIQRILMFWLRTFERCVGAPWASGPKL